MQAINDSILLTVKKLCNIAPDCEHFDIDLIADINSVFASLWTMGLGTTPFLVTGTTESWSDIPNAFGATNILKVYVPLMVHKIFDAPTTTSVSQALNEVLDEYGWRIFEVLDGNFEEGGITNDA